MLAISSFDAASFIVWNLAAEDVSTALIMKFDTVGGVVLSKGRSLTGCSLTNFPPSMFVPHHSTNLAQSVFWTLRYTITRMDGCQSRKAGRHLIKVDYVDPVRLVKHHF